MLEGMFRYPVILRKFISENSAGIKNYEPPVYIMAYFYGDAELTLRDVSVSLSNDVTVVTNSPVKVKENDIIVLPTQYEAVFKNETDRDKAIGDPVKNATWCIVGKKIYVYGDDGWTDDYKWEKKVDGELISTYSGEQNTVSAVAPFLKGMWDKKHKDMVIQSIKLK
jgi:hypothetical protein